MNRKDIQVYTNLYKNFKAVVLELLYPSKCVFCMRYSREEICKRCQEKYPSIKEPRCMRCGQPIEDREALYCKDCDMVDKYFTQGKSVWVHKGAVKASIYRLKYHNQRANVQVYGKHMAQLLLSEWKEWNVECMIPVPLHKKRQRQRGFNQSELLAREINRYLPKGLVIDTKMIVRIKSTKAQKKLDNRKRVNNIKGAFRIVEEGEMPNSVLIVDDIYTTGATINEISRLLKQKGVKYIYYLTISIGQGF